MKSTLRWRPIAIKPPRLLFNARLLTSKANSFLNISDEVEEAVQSHKPVVALETTVYTHGFPYPENIALSSQLESVVRARGGIPATIGVLNGVAKVGFRAEELVELLETASKQKTMKLSRRDLGYICGVGVRGRRMNGGTTIAATMILAHLAGIKVFATGGLGGVHKGGENSMDISADLTELGRTPVALVSSGCKSFLDIPRTLEYLETQGVGVGTFADGRTGSVDFPAFWTRDSGVPSPTTIQDEAEAAAIIHAQMTLSISSGLLFANPIPLEQSLPKEWMDEVMSQAIHEADREGISGSHNTPFVLARIRELTKGSTVTANRVLVEENVVRGTKVAVELAKLERQGSILLEDNNPVWRFIPTTNVGENTTVRKGSSVSQQSTAETIVESPNSSDDQVKVIVAGSLAIDLSCDYRPTSRTAKLPLSGTSNPATITQSIGGVGQNVATAIHYLGLSVSLCTAVGSDAQGKHAINVISDRGMNINGVKALSNGSRTAQYVALNDAKKDLVMAMADMTIMESSGRHFAKLWQPDLHRHRPKWLVVDGNWDSAALSNWISAGRDVGANIAYEPVSAEKAGRIFEQDKVTLFDTRRVADLASPNVMELEAMVNGLEDCNFDPDVTAAHSALNRLVDRSSHRNSWSVFLGAVLGSNSFSKLAPEEQAKFDADYGHLQLRALKHKLGERHEHVLLNALKLLPKISTVLTKLGPDGVLLTQFLPQDHADLQSKHAIYTKPEHGNDIKANLRRSLAHLDTLGLVGEHDLSNFDIDDHTLHQVGGVYVRLFPPAEVVPQDQVVSVNGVGDTFLGIIVAGLAKESPKSIDELVEIAQKGAVMTLKSEKSVSEEIAKLEPFL